MLRYFLLTAALAPSLWASAERSVCIVVDNEYVLAKDVASVYPEFLALDGDTALSYAPAPGGRRSVSAIEISGWAQSHGLHMHAQEGACFERTGVTLTSEDYRKAIRRQLNMSTGEAEVDVLDFCSHVLPPGRLELPVSGAALPPRDHPETAFLWRGQLISSAGASYPVWARVRILGNRNVVRAVRDLPAGAILDSQELTSALEKCNPFRPGDVKPLSFYVGKSLTRSLTRGSRLDPGLVQDPPTVQRGDRVLVAVVSGSARLELEALADASGYVGDSILFRNPSGSRHFLAHITGVGRAELILNSAGEDMKHRTAIQTLASKGNL
jgi:flagellar basal body P-ring formation protein FlgA